MWFISVILEKSDGNTYYELITQGVFWNVLKSEVASTVPKLKWKGTLLHC